MPPRVTDVRELSKSFEFFDDQLRKRATGDVQKISRDLSTIAVHVNSREQKKFYSKLITIRFSEMLNKGKRDERSSIFLEHV